MSRRGGSGNYRNPCLTMHQPWASLLVHGIKRIEGRSWPSPIKGRLWIHAAGKVPDQATIKAMEDFYREIYAVDGIMDIKFPENYPTSRLLGCVEVVGCVTLEELKCWEEIPEGVRLEGQTNFCWLCEQPQKLIVPFEMRGFQGVYNLERKVPPEQQMEDTQQQAEALQPLSKIVPIPKSQLTPYRMVIILRLIILGLFFHYRVTNPFDSSYGLWLTSVICSQRPSLSNHSSPAAKVPGLDIGGEVNIAAGIQVAQLALKHRQNKKQQQRIIVFTGGPVKYEKKVLEMIGRKLKKNSVALDVVNFGEEDEAKTEKLEALVSAVNNESSHIVHVPSGASALSDVLISTPIFTGDGEGGSGLAAAAAAAGGVSGFDFDVDPNVDPELALALRVSMEEERARQEEAAKKAADEALNQEKRGEQASTSQDIIMSALRSSEADNNTADLMDDENALLQQALAMSMDDPAVSRAVSDTDMVEAVADDQELALALQLSVQNGAKDQSGHTDMSNLLADQSFVSSILASLPGVDPNDPSVKDLLASMQNQSEPEQKKDEDNEGNS